MVDCENPLWQRNVQHPQRLGDSFGGQIALEELPGIRAEVCGLKATQYLAKSWPGLLAGPLGHSLDEKGENADLHVGLNATRQPVVHRHHLDLRSLQAAEAALDD